MEFYVETGELEQFKEIKSILEGSENQLDDTISVYDYIKFCFRVVDCFKSVISDYEKTIEKETGIFIKDIKILQSTDSKYISISSEKGKILYEYCNGDFYLADSSYMLEEMYKVHYFLMTRGNEILRRLYHFIQLPIYHFNIDREVNDYFNVKIFIFSSKDDKALSTCAIKNIKAQSRIKARFNFYLEITPEDEIIFVSGIPSVMRLLSNNEITFLKNLNIPKNILKPDVLSLLEIEKTIGIRQYFDQIVTDSLNEDMGKVKKIEKFMNEQ